MRIEPLVPEEFGSEPEVLAGVRGEAFEQERLLGHVPGEEDLADRVGLGGVRAASRQCAGPAGGEDHRCDILVVEVRGEVVAAEHEQPFGRCTT